MVGRGRGTLLWGGMGFWLLSAVVATVLVKLVERSCDSFDDVFAPNTDTRLSSIYVVFYVEILRNSRSSPKITGGNPELFNIIFLWTKLITEAVQNAIRSG